MIIVGRFLRNFLIIIFVLQISLKRHAHIAIKCRKNNFSHDILLKLWLFNSFRLWKRVKTLGKWQSNNELIIPSGFFKVKKVFLVEITHFLKNESSFKQFIKNFDEFTDDKFGLETKWQRTKVETLFIALYQYRKIYKVFCL